MAHFPDPFGSAHSCSARAVKAIALAFWVGLGPAAGMAEEPTTPVLRVLANTKIAEASLGFNEPSGLALASDGVHYWSVSDDTGIAFAVTANGKLKPNRSIPVYVKGLEGIVEDAANNRLLVVREETAEIISVNLADQTISRHALKDMRGFAAIADLFGAIGSNNGLEGITVDLATGDIYLIKEKGPRLLIHLSADLTSVLGAVELTADHGFACAGIDDVKLDVSDVTYDRDRQTLWILSDTGSCLFLLDPKTGAATSFPLSGSADGGGKKVKNAEGLALNADETELRIVTDDAKESRMITLSIE
jgi:uncharacterized protein YjiK